MDILQYKFIIVVGVFWAAVFGWIAFMANDNLPPYVYDTENSSIVPDPAGSGDQVIVKWKLKAVNRMCLGSIRRTLFDPRTRVILATYDPSPAALSSSIQNKYLNLSFALPKAIPPGEIGYRAEVCYQCNFYQQYVRPLCITSPELKFVVRP